MEMTLYEGFVRCAFTITFCCRLLISLLHYVFGECIVALRVFIECSLALRVFIECSLAFGVLAECYLS